MNMELFIIGFLVIIFVLYWVWYFIERLFPKINFNVIAFIAAILFFSSSFTINITWVLTESYVLIFISLCVLNFFGGLLIGNTKLLYKLQDLAGGASAKIGKHLTENGRPTFAWFKPFEGKAFPHPMEVIKKPWLHGLIVSFISNSMIFLLYLFCSSNETTWRNMFIFPPLEFLKNSFLGWCEVILLILILSLFGALGASLWIRKK